MQFLGMEILSSGLPILVSRFMTTNINATWAALSGPSRHHIPKDTSMSFSCFEFIDFWQMPIDVGVNQSIYHGMGQ